MEKGANCRFGFIHVIEQGDTLYKLGKRYGVKVSALMLANPWVNVYNLQIGDELCIPDFRCDAGVEEREESERNSGM